MIRKAGLSKIRKFSIIAMLISVAVLAMGTILESMYGTAFAKKIVYNSWWFKIFAGAVLICLVSSFFFKPHFRYRFIGFHMIHFSLIILIIGAFLTSLYGVNGHLVLGPSYPSSSIFFDDADVIVISRRENVQVRELPSLLLKKNLNLSVQLGEGQFLRIKEYIPFANSSEGKPIKKIKVEYSGKKGGKESIDEVWVTSENPTALGSEDQRFHVYFGKKEFEIPFSLELKQFRIIRDRKNGSIVDYESLVSLKETSETFRIKMNHPLRIEGHTLYQSSYFKNSEGGYSSVLVVNKDPGRILKYLASFMLTMGMILHYFVFAQGGRSVFGNSLQKQ